MQGLKRILLQEEKRLKGIVVKTRAALMDVPEGTLRISKNKNIIQYYHHTKNSKNKNGEYIAASKKELVQKLAQKEYDLKLLKLTERRLKQISILTREYTDDEIENIYREESLERQLLITPVELTWDELVEKWSNESYNGRPFQPGIPEIYTDKGERVRSKSEKIIADYLYHHDILYKYEKPLYLNGYGVIYPDFTCLSRKTGSEMYWEHYGMMDDPSYSRKAIKKILLYEKNNIFVGESLIQTYETNQTILNTNEIEMMAKKYLL